MGYGIKLKGRYRTPAETFQVAASTSVPFRTLVFGVLDCLFQLRFFYYVGIVATVLFLAVNFFQSLFFLFKAVAPIVFFPLCELRYL